MGRRFSSGPHFFCLRLICIIIQPVYIAHQQKVAHLVSHFSCQIAPNDALLTSKERHGKSPQSFEIAGFSAGAPGEIRTRGLHIRSVLLYPLSYWRINIIYFFESKYATYFTTSGSSRPQPARQASPPTHVNTTQTLNFCSTQTCSILTSV